MKYKPTIFLGIGEIGCDVVELCRKRITQTNPEGMWVIRALGIELERVGTPRKRNFHVENLSGFVPTKITQRSIAERKDDLLYWFHSNVNKERLVRLNEIIQSDPQIRPLGRLALFLKANIIQKILENFFHDIRLIWKQNEDPINLIIISPISDGLGSGAVIDLSFIARAAANSEKVSVNVITIFLTESADNQNKSMKQLKDANSYALLMEVSSFQDRKSHYRNLMQRESQNSEEGKVFNLCYLFNINKGAGIFDENMRSHLSHGVELLSLAPQDSARRIMADQVGSDEINFGSFGAAVLKNNIDDVLPICSKKLSRELLRMILGVDSDKEVENRNLYFNIENFTPTFIDSFEKKYNENLSALPTLPWRKLKKINENNLTTLRDDILNKRVGDLDKIFENHFGEVKETLSNDLKSQYKNLLEVSQEGLKGSRRFLEEISGKLDSFFNLVEKNVRDMDTNIDKTSENFQFLFTQLKKTSKRTLLKRLKDLFSKEWYAQKKEMVERFHSLLSDYVSKGFKSRVRRSSLKFYNEIQEVVRNIDIEAKQKGTILNPLLDDLEKEIANEIEEMPLKRKDGFPIFEIEHLDRIYKKYKPKSPELFENFHQNNPDFWSLIDWDDMDGIISILQSTCTRYFNHLSSIGIPGFVQDEGVLSLKDILTRLYLLSCPKIEEEALDRKEFYERIITRSGIHDSQFKNIKEEVGFDSELIFDGNLVDEISMVREWYGVTLSRLPLLKDIEHSYIQLRKEGFPLHTVDAEQISLLPFVSYPAELSNNMKSVFLVGIALNCIIIRSGMYLWMNSEMKEIELGTGKENAFLSFIENSDISCSVEECIHKTIIDEGKEKVKKSVKALLRESDLNLLTGKEIEMLRKFYENAISK